METRATIRNWKKAYLVYFKVRRLNLLLPERHLLWRDLSKDSFLRTTFSTPLYPSFWWGKTKTSRMCSGPETIKMGVFSISWRMRLRARCSSQMSRTLQSLQRQAASRAIERVSSHSRTKAPASWWLRNRQNQPREIKRQTAILNNQRTRKLQTLTYHRLIISLKAKCSMTSPTPHAATQANPGQPRGRGKIASRLRIRYCGTNLISISTTSTKRAIGRSRSETRDQRSSQRQSLIANKNQFLRPKKNLNQPQFR